MGRLAAGSYTLRVRARSACDGTIHEAATTFSVRREPWVVIDAPGTGATVHQPFLLHGWAADTTVPSGTGVDAIHVYA